MPPGVGPYGGSRQGGAGSWMLSFPPPLSPSSSFSFAAVGEGEQKKNTISLFKPKQTHSGLRFNMNLWNAGMMSGGRAPLRLGGAVPMGTAPLSHPRPCAHGVRRSFWTAPHGRTAGLSRRLPAPPAPARRAVEQAIPSGSAEGVARVAAD